MGGAVQCRYEEDSQRLTIRGNPLFFPDFFTLPGTPAPEAVITNVTAIVGENGSGKSTILNFLKVISGGFRSNIESILVYRQSDGSLVIYYHKNCPVKIINSTKSEVVSHLLSEMDFEDLNYVYYSAVFDLQREEHAYVGALKNISTNYLIKQDIINSYSSSKYDVENHKTKEMERQVRLVSSLDAHFVSKVFQLPEELTVSIQQVNMEPMYREMHKFPATKFFQELIAELQAQKPPMEQYTIDYYRKFDFMRALMIRCIQQLFLEMPPFFHVLEAECRKFHKIRNSELSDKVVIWLNRIKTSLKKSGDASDAVSFMEGLIQTLHFFDENIWNEKITLINGSVVISIQQELRLFQELQQKISKTIGNTSILDFEWRDLSSGEKALLNLYARFYSLVHNYKGDQPLKKNIIVMIDEGELYFHPEWQRRLISNILTFIPNVLGRYGAQAVQIILTSNSPFIVSDLPQSHIIFLKKEGSASSVIPRLDDRHQTFSANIHNLLSHTFFMQNGSMGEFAKQKINTAIDLLINGKNNDIKARRAEMEYIISIIGEPVLRHQLISLFEDRLSIMPLDLEERVQVLEKEMLKLQRGEKHEQDKSE